MWAVVALALVAEGLLTALWVAGRLPTLVIYSPLTILIIGVRAIVGALQFASGWMLIRRVPPAAIFAKAALIASATLLTIELGAEITPTNLFPSYRWPVIGVYWVYVGVASWVLRRSIGRGPAS